MKKPLPERPSLDHLKKQAKDLIRAYQRGDSQALAEFREHLPLAAGRSDAEIAALGLRLHDAQSCVARSYGFPSFAELAAYVEAGGPDDLAERRMRWLKLVYAGDVSGNFFNRANPRLALRMLEERPGLGAGDPYLACAIGDLIAIRKATAADPGWVRRAGGPLRLPPLAAVAHSSFLQLPEFSPRLRDAARLLLLIRADPNQRFGHRLPPASLDHPDDGQTLSALYGAAGVNRDAELTLMLLQAGADPNDNESLYHSLESIDCTRTLLQHGARVTGSNAMYRVLDLDALPVLELLLAHGGDPNEPAGGPPTSDWGTPLLWAIYRRRSRRHVEALIKAGASPHAKNPAGVSAYSLARQFGLSDVAALLAEHGAAVTLSEEEEFIAACASGDEALARRLQASRPDLPGSLPKESLQLLPVMVANGSDEGARTMVRLGWPIAVRGGDWSASALNHAVFFGNAAMARFLLEHGARWSEEHGHGDNVLGTLSWASSNEPIDGGDWTGCARVLRDNGLPAATRDPEDAEVLVLAGKRRRFSGAVTAVLLGSES